jgi:hypothetical protein
MKLIPDAYLCSSLLKKLSYLETLMELVNPGLQFFGRPPPGGFGIANADFAPVLEAVTHMMKEASKPVVQQQQQVQPPKKEE